MQLRTYILQCCFIHALRIVIGVINTFISMKDLESCVNNFYFDNLYISILDSYEKDNDDIIFILEIYLIFICDSY